MEKWVQSQISLDIGISQIDRKILKILLAPNSQKTTKSISTKLGIPVTTVRRRRKRLEGKFFESAICAGY